MLRIAIIDDEADARFTLRTFLKKYCSEDQLVGEASGVAESYQLILQEQPDVLLLDIAMQDGTGFDLLDKFSNFNFQVIFTTAFDDFAIKAFQYNALDYLLKPIDADDLVRSLKRVRANSQKDFQQKIKGLLKLTQTQQVDKIALSSMKGLIFLRLNDITHLEADGNYTTFWMMNGESHTVVRTIKEYEELLPTNFFFRCHQSHIVNLNFVKRFIKEDGGQIQLDNGKKITVSRRKKDRLIERLTE